MYNKYMLTYFGKFKGENCAHCVGVAELHVASPSKLQFQETVLDLTCRIPLPCDADHVAHAVLLCNGHNPCARGLCGAHRGHDTRSACMQLRLRCKYGRINAAVCVSWHAHVQSLRYNASDLRVRVFGLLQLLLYHASSAGFPCCRSTQKPLCQSVHCSASIFGWATRHTCT